MGERVAYTSPWGEVFECHLTETARFKGKDTGSYTCTLVFEGEALEKLKQDLNEFLVDTYGPKKAAQVWKDKPPIKVTKDGEKSFIRWSTKAVDKDGKARKVMIYDSKGNPVKRELNIGSGSIIRVKGTIGAFPSDDPGLAFYMDSIQVIKYVEYVPPAC
ncbi:hypothetical protein [Acidocella aromatica]|uniref:Uncharacterized protein n=1 Tax=Acidocella aromatica TaxID=1303579 RepID=A0A840VBR2_9PROT|nr:hypothetical protein [Acidocella aromatica]MBB5372277.1 hypothetical protein [Acidocella aromatica]